MVFNLRAQNYLFFRLNQNIGRVFNQFFVGSFYASFRDVKVRTRSGARASFFKNTAPELLPVAGGSGFVFRVCRSPYRVKTGVVAGQSRVAFIL